MTDRDKDILNRIVNKIETNDISYIKLIEDNWIRIKLRSNKGNIHIEVNDYLIHLSADSILFGRYIRVRLIDRFSRDIFDVILKRKDKDEYERFRNLFIEMKNKVNEEDINRILD